MHVKDIACARCGLADVMVDRGMGVVQEEAAQCTCMRDSEGGRERSVGGEPAAAASMASAAGLWFATHTLERLAASSPA